MDYSLIFLSCNCSYRYFCYCIK